MITASDEHFEKKKHKNAVERVQWFVGQNRNRNSTAIPLRIVCRI
jgi:hypothetical protein